MNTSKTIRYFYAAHSYMGMNYTYDSPCWKAYRFEKKAERDAWVDKNEYKDGNRVAESVTLKIAYKIIGYKSSTRYWDTEVWTEDDGRGPWLLFRVK